MSDGLLVIDELDRDYRKGSAVHRLPIPVDSAWTAKTRMGLHQDSDPDCSSFYVLTGDSEYAGWSFDIDHTDEQWVIDVFKSSSGDWIRLERGEDGINYGDGEFNSITMTLVGATLTVWANDEKLVSLDYSNGMPWGGDAPPGVTDVGLAMEFCREFSSTANTEVAFDWVEVGPEALLNR